MRTIRRQQQRGLLIPLTPNRKLWVGLGIHLILKAIQSRNLEGIINWQDKNLIKLKQCICLKKCSHNCPEEISSGRVG